MLRGSCIDARWSKEIMEALPDGEVVMSRGTVDYHGSCDFAARLDDGRWLHVHWAYGSCAVCDDYEDMASEVRDTAFRALADAMPADVFADYIIGCVGTGAEWLTGKHEASTGLATAEELLARVLHRRRIGAGTRPTTRRCVARAKALVEAAELERRDGQ